MDTRAWLRYFEVNAGGGAAIGAGWLRAYRRRARGDRQARSRASRSAGPRGSRHLKSGALEFARGEHGLPEGHHLSAGRTATRRISPASCATTRPPFAKTTWTDEVFRALRRAALASS